MDPTFERSFEGIRASDCVESAIFGFRDAYGLAHATFHSAQMATSSVGVPYIRTTYPSEWISRYLVKGYVNIDPVIKSGFQRSLPFDWSEIEVDVGAEQLLTEAKLFGVGCCGYSIPVIDESGRRSLLSVNSDWPADKWSKFSNANKQDWAELAHAIHRRAILEMFGELDPAPRLGRRELECLRWTAQGKDYKDIALILQISPHTTRGYLKAARHKLDCANLSQAVAKAIKLGMI